MPKINTGYRGLCGTLILLFAIDYLFETAFGRQSIKIISNSHDFVGLARTDG